MATAAPTFTITQGDLAPLLTATLLDADGTPVDLTDATAVAFTMRAQIGGAPKIAAVPAAFVAPRTGGQVTYTWVAGDTDTVGTYLAKFTVTWGNDTTTSFPTGATHTAPNFITVVVTDNAGTVG